MIDHTGTNLGIIIDCDYGVGHHWMAFASWYSIYKNLPDAQMIVRPKRGMSKLLIFNWTYKCGVPCIFFSPNLDFSKLFFNVEDVITLPCSVMAVRNFNEFGILGPLSTKSEELPTFVDYSDGCGSFVLSSWINRADGPFALTEQFVNGDLTSNEMKVLKLWEKMFPTFKEVNK